MKYKILVILGLLLILPIATATNIDLARENTPEENLLTIEHINDNMNRFTDLFIKYPYTEHSWKLFYPSLHREICLNIPSYYKFWIRLTIEDYCR